MENFITESLNWHHHLHHPALMPYQRGLGFLKEHTIVTHNNFSVTSIVQELLYRYQPQVSLSLCIANCDTEVACKMMNDNLLYYGTLATPFHVNQYVMISIAPFADVDIS